MTRKWQRLAALGRKRISYSYPAGNDIGEAFSATTSGCSFPSPAAEKGHFVVYTADDENRYSFPIAYLNNPIFRVLFNIAEEEFGEPSDWPIMIPCDGAFMDYVISLVGRRPTKDIERALLQSLSMASCRRSYAYAVHQQQTIHSTSLPGF